MSNPSHGDDRPLADLTWPEIEPGQVILLPLGSLEQHGPHLPLDVDTVIASAVAEGASRLLNPRPLVAPALSFGASGEHQSFAGTVSVGSYALERYLVELTRSVSQWAQRIVFVNGHGGNVDALRRACGLLRDEGRNASWVPCSHGDIHAGHGETSIMLHLNRERVHMERAVEGASGELAALLPLMRRGGVTAVTKSGVIGDPRTATDADGARLMEQMITEVAARITTATVGADGRLAMPL